MAKKLSPGVTRGFVVFAGILRVFWKKRVSERGFLMVKRGDMYG
jgi:hypothetical protein